MSEDGVPYTVVRKGRRLANEQAGTERLLLQKRQREQRRSAAAAWREHHERLAALHRQLALEHEQKLEDLIGRL